MNSAWFHVFCSILRFTMFSWKELMNYRHFWHMVCVRAPSKNISDVVSYLTSLTKLAHNQSMANDWWLFQNLLMLLQLSAQTAYPRKFWFFWKNRGKWSKIAQICFLQSFFWVFHDILSLSFYGSDSTLPFKQFSNANTLMMLI